MILHAAGSLWREENTARREEKEMMEEKAREGKVCVSPQLRWEVRGRVMQKEDIDMLPALNIDCWG